MKHIALIAACDRSRAIGKNGKIPWNIAGEQQRFRQLTTGQTVIFGRRTYEEIGHPLPCRETIVVSASRQFSGSHLQTVPMLAEALAAAKTEWVFVGGGARLYAEAMPLAEMLYLTEIDGFFQGDVFFPPLPAGQFARIAEERHDGEIPYVYVTYRRNTKNGRKSDLPID